MGRKQLLNTLPEGVRIWVSEWKPKMSAEAAGVADNYPQAREQSKESKIWAEEQTVKPKPKTKQCMAEWATSPSIADNG